MKLKTLAIVVAILAVLSLAAYCLQRSAGAHGKDPRTDEPVFDMKALEMAAGTRLSDQGKWICCRRRSSCCHFNIISELSRTLALAVRLFGNMMSGTMIIAILLTITPYIFPHRHERARPADRHGAGLHLQHPGRRSTSPRRRATRKQAAQSKVSRMTNRNGKPMDSMTIVAVASIVTAGLTIAMGGIGPALGKDGPSPTALSSLAQQPDAGDNHHAHLVRRAGDDRNHCDLLL